MVANLRIDFRWAAKGLAELGWTNGGDLRMNFRWTGGSVDRARMYAEELVDLQPEVILQNRLRRPLCSSGRELTKLGHQVRLMPAKDVKAHIT
jgi:hypothetical protein